MHVAISIANEVNPIDLDNFFNSLPVGANKEKIKINNVSSNVCIYDYYENDAQGILFSLNKRFLIYAKFSYHIDVDELKDFFVNNFYISSGFIKLKEKFGGSGVFALIDKDADKAVCWTSTPPLFPWFYSVDGARNVIATRPIICSNLVQGNSLNFDREFLRQYLVSGFSLDSTSPFENIKILEVNSTLIATCRKVVSVSRHPNSSVEYDWEKGLDENAKEGAAILSHSCSLIKKTNKPLEIYMSGGVDSRVLLSSFANVVDEKLIYTSTTLSSPGEMFVAQKLSQKLNTAHHCTFFNEMLPEEVLENTKKNIFQSGGVPNSEAHLLGLRLPSQLDKDGIASFGNWPLYKGGYMKGFTKGYKNIFSRIKSTAISNIATDEANSPSIEIIDDWIASQVEYTPLELLYLYALDFRSWKWLLPNTLQVSHSRTAHYPFLDEKFVDFSSSVSAEQRATHRLAFKMIKELNSNILNIGLYNQRWKFESKEAVEGFIEGYNERVPISDNDAPDFFHFIPSCSPRKPSEKLSSLIHEHVNEILLKQNPDIFEFLNKDIRLLFSKDNAEFMNAFSRNYINIWKVFVASVFVEGSWRK